MGGFDGLDGVLGFVFTAAPHVDCAVEAVEDSRDFIADSGIGARDDEDFAGLVGEVLFCQCWGGNIE